MSALWHESQLATPQREKLTSGPLRATTGLGVYIKIFPHEITECDRIAIMRHQHARASGYDHRREVAADLHMKQDIDSVRTEKAWSKYLPWLKWHRFTTGSVKGLPDIGDFIDVKAMTLDGHNLLVPVEDLRLEWVYALTSTQSHPYYWLAGWIWGYEMALCAPIRVMRAGREPSYVLPPGALHKPHELRQVVAGRNAQ